MPRNPEVLTLERCLENHAFQEWLVSQWVMVRYKSEFPDLSFKTKEIRSKQTAERFIGILNRNYGYIVPSQALAVGLYGKASQTELNRVNSWGDWIRKEKLNHPELLFNAREIGWGLGIKLLRVTPQSLTILYGLWQQLLQPVAEKDLAFKVKGYTDEAAIRSIRTQIYLLRSSQLKVTSAGIEVVESRNNSDRHYRLTHGKEVRPDYALPMDMIQFQQWLCAPVNRLMFTIPRLSKFEQRLDFRRKDHRLLDFLQQHRGYIVPFNLLSQVIYGNDDQKTQVMELFNYLKRTKQLDFSQVLVVPELGIGYGVKDMKLTNKQFSLLYLLWDINSPVCAEDLVQSIYGDDNTADQNTLFSLVSKTRRAMSRSVYQIESLKINKQLHYQLVRK